MRVSAAAASRPRRVRVGPKPKPRAGASGPGIIGPMAAAASATGIFSASHSTSIGPHIETSVKIASAGQSASTARRSATWPGIVSTSQSRSILASCQPRTRRPASSTTLSVRRTRSSLSRSNANSVKPACSIVSRADSPL